MDMPDILALMGALCALTMVIFSFVLLYRGTITLQQASPQDAIKVEFQKVINVQTRYPALGLFVVGISFLIVSYWFEHISRESTAKSAEIQIPVDSDDPVDTRAHFFSDFGDVLIDNERKIVKTLPGDLDEVEVHYYRNRVPNLGSRNSPEPSERRKTHNERDAQKD
jgi:hypothetical protein